MTFLTAGGVLDVRSRTSSEICPPRALEVAPRWTVLLVLLTALALATPGAGFAQAIDQDLWATNGSVEAVVRDGGTIYIGGQFTRVGLVTGGGAPIDAASGVPPASFPKVMGSVYAVATDGAGGWYIGGQFSAVGGLPRSNVAHVASNLSVSAWNPDANGIVRALAVRGATVYAGGDFTVIGGAVRGRAADLDATTGSALSWNGDADAEVHAIAVSGSTIYLAGGFTTIGEQARNQIAALDALTEQITAWDPNAQNVSVYALAVSGSTVYAGGAFTNIGGQPRSRIAALDASTGLATAWNPHATSEVRCLAVSGSTVYVGGFFSTIGGPTRNYLAAIDASTGSATSWNPDPDDEVYALAVNGSAIYACGKFSNVGGQARNRIAALDATTGAATAWNPNADAPAYAVAVSGSTIYAGGTFIGLGWQTRNYIAALDAATGIPKAWNPNAGNSVYALAVSGSTVFAGGGFGSIGGQARSGIAALDATTGLAKPWDPNATGGQVITLAVSGNTVYAGGSFTSIGGQARNYVAALNATTGLATAWDPGASGVVFSLAVSGTVVYVGGSFANIGGQPRSRIAALDATSGLATAWDPNANNIVYALAVSGSAVYAGGWFTSIGGQSRSHIAALDATTGLATAWNPSANGGGIVFGLATSGSTVYAGGIFTSIGGASRNRIAALDATTGLATAWNPNANAQVNDLVVSEGHVYAVGEFTNIASLPHAYFAGIAEAPQITSVEAARGGDDGPITLGVSGLGFQGGATVKLARSGESDIAGSQVQVAANGRSLAATLDLTGAALGAWDVVVTMPDLQIAALPMGFTVESGSPYQIRVNVLGPTQLRPNRRKAFDVVLENLGNSDVVDVPLWISGIPASATVDLDFALASPPQGGGEPDWSTAPLTLDGPSGKYLALVIPRLPPGTRVRRLYLTVPNPVTSFTLDAALTPPWADGDVFRDCLSGGGVITAPSCMGAQLTAIRAYLAATPGIEALNGIGLWAKIAWQCEGAATLPAALAKAEQILDFMLQPVEGSAVPSGCEVSLVPRWQDRRLVTIVTSVDPNDKLGTGGVGPGGLIGSEQLLPYSIRFENLESATAPAQEVLVTDALDTATLDVGTVSLGPITFGNRTVYPPPGLTNYTTDVDLSPAPLIVRVAVSLDLATGVMSWSLTSIDPATGALPEDPQVGFLPANVMPPQGEGSVLFTVLPKPALAGGTAIRNRATIHFDGVPLLTPEWANLLDTTPPTSAVLPLGATQDSASFTVRWGASGPPPDLRDYSVYVSESGGAYRPWRAHTTATADTIVAPGGRTYSFYSLARDSSGNLEPAKTTPDVQTFSRVAVENGARPRFALEGAVPNPVIGEARVWFTLPSRERAVLDVIDVTGRRVLRREVGQLGQGRHSVDLSAGLGKPGLYFLRLSQGDQTMRARVAKIQ